ncbi:MAG: outer membrane protein assembly factor BamD [Bacteroidia bacterium]|nr:outer membrane protein assembly factor BamD [Bacteroidia bacterium]
MQKNIRIIGLALLIALMTVGCGKEYKKFSKWSRKGTVAQKDSAAFYFYERKDYDKASFLLEELQTAYRGQPRAKEVLYAYAYSKYGSGYYTTAAFNFEQYSKLYPNDPLAPECMYMVGYCAYLESAPYYLDQAATLKAISQFQLFINNYPVDERSEKANTLMTELRERLAKKAFENANVYFKIQNFRAATKAFEVMIQEFPDSRYREEAQYLWFKSAADLADNSIFSKKKNRYLDALDLYERFIDKYPNSVFVKDAEAAFVKAKKGYGKVLAGEANGS